MKRNQLLIWALVACITGESILFAQVAKVGETVVKKGLTESAGSAAVTAGIHKATTNALPKVVGEIAPVAKPVVEAHPTVNPRLAKMVNDNKKMLYKLQTTAGVSPKRAVLNLRRWGAKELKKPRRPSLQMTETFQVADFTELAYRPGIRPILPFHEKSDRMYRGLVLPTDGSALKNILEKGLLLKDVSASNNNLRITYAAGAERTPLPDNVREVSNKAFNNITDSPADAVSFAMFYMDKGLLVLASIKESVQRAHIVALEEDIPVDKIDEIIALVEIEGVPTWCRVELAKEGFKLTPYRVVEKK